MNSRKVDPPVLADGEAGGEAIDEAPADSRLRALLDSAVDAIITINSKGIIQEVNPAVERIFGYSPEELRGQNLSILMPSPMRERHDGFISSYLRTGNKGVIGTGREVVALKKDGSCFHAHLTVSEFHSRGRHEFLGVVRDISAIKRAEASSRRLAAVVESSDDAIITKSLDGTITSWNESAERLFGYTADEAIGAKSSSLVPVDRLGEEAQILDRLAAGERIDHFETVRVRRNGTQLDVSVTVSPLHDDREAVVGASSIVRDISERKKLERMQAEFVSNVSHELRTPLTAIRGALGLVAGGVTGELTEETREYIDIALTNSERLIRIVNDILDIEKIESGKMEFQMRTVALDKVIDDALVANASFAASHETELVLESDVPAGDIFVDIDRFAQVMANLISNAAKFSPPHSPVELAAEKRGNWVRVSVRDYGPGIPMEFRGKLFERFAQADGSSRRRKGGTGLGLSISKAITERMRGRIGFEDAHGGGSRFYLDIPLLAPVCADGALSDRPRVLVCEEDLDAARVLRRLLEDNGNAVDLSPTIERARRLLDCHRYAAVLLDLKLGDGRGSELVREMRQRKATRLTPVVAVMASDGRLGELGLSISDIIYKPIDEQHLLEVVERAIEIGHTQPAPRLLHVEDDQGLRRVVERVMPASWIFVGVEDLAGATEALDEQSFDVVLLDLALPDGSGEDLLDRVGNAKVVIFSASEAPQEMAERVSAALVKSRTELNDVRQTIMTLLHNSLSNDTATH
ncbi:PAS domain S-box protein [Persicimonas caeni]|nr:PAS domain S-box protein [Persicimonas caeni]